MTSFAATVDILKKSAVGLKNGPILIVRLLTIISVDLPHTLTPNKVKRKSGMRPFSSQYAAFCLDTILILKGIPLILVMPPYIAWLDVGVQKTQS